MLTPAAPRDAATAFAAASSSEAAVAKCASSRRTAASAALVPTIRTTIGTSRSWTARASIRPRATSSPRVMPPKMLTRIALTFGSARMIRIAAATLSARAPPPMSRKLAGSPPARLTRSIVVIARPAPLTMQPIVPSSLMKVRPASRASRSAGSSSSGSRSASSSGWRASAESSSVTLASRQTSRSTAAPSASGLADDRQRVDLDQVGVVGEHRPDEALGDRDRGLEVPAEAHREGELAGLEVEQPEERVGVVADDRLGVVDRDLLDLDAALGRAHQQDPPRGAVEDGRHVVLADDVGGRRDEHLADRDALDVHAEDGRRDRARPRRRSRRASRRRPCRARRRGPGP